MADECGGHIVVQNATFKDYIRLGESWSHYIDRKKKNTWKIYTVKKIVKYFCYKPL